MAHVASERLRNHRLVRPDRIPDVLPFRGIAATPVGSVRALGELDAFGGKQERGPIDDGEKTGRRVQVLLRSLRRSDVRVGDLAGAKRQ